MCLQTIRVKEYNMSNLKFIHTALNHTLTSMGDNYRGLDTCIQEALAAGRGYNQTRSELEGARRARKQDPANVRRLEDEMTSSTLRLLAAREPLYASLKDVVAWLKVHESSLDLDAPALVLDGESWKYSVWVDRKVKYNNLVCTMELVMQGIDVFAAMQIPTLDPDLEARLIGLAGKAGYLSDVLPELPVRNNAQTRAIADLLLQILSASCGERSGAVDVSTDGVGDTEVSAAVKVLRDKGWKVETKMPGTDSAMRRGVTVRKSRRKSRA